MIYILILIYLRFMEKHELFFEILNRHQSILEKIMNIIITWMAVFLSFWSGWRGCVG